MLPFQLKDKIAIRTLLFNRWWSATDVLSLSWTKA